ncbi:Holin of 3TMs, for gene-transfer release [uncultured Caudovirales phage]|uniref:Holin of 3TMs, for gene-transfer release n=1 Tax=uncultured Caudovirales phage TaxID=2100421 RepID=A0A6J5LY41_9CAUD|nr:Holin of 3TMs, for gene-transfer release [uncultured Caudovirales phage]
MNPLLLGPIFELGKTLIDRWLPDPQKKAEAEMELFKMAQAGDLQKVIGQLEINAKEATHQSIFVAGWRPFAGWVGGFGLAYASVGHYILVWLSGIYGFVAPPQVDTEILLYVLGGMLGLGTLRTYEKKQGVTK